MQSYFYELADYIKEQLSPGQEYTARFSAEDSDFIRFNHGRVRQSGTVRQRSLFIDLIEGKRHVQGSLGLAGGLQEDRHRVRQLIAGLSGRLPEVAEDPHLLYSTEVRSTEARRKDRVPEPAVVLEAVSAASEGRDLVGVYAGGGIEEGFANSLGQRNWFATHNFHLDWSFYLEADRAVKCSYAGEEWQNEEFARRVDAAAAQLEVLGKKARPLRPGAYRVYLAPTAVAEIVGILSWGGFSLRAQRSGGSALLRMVKEGARLSEAVTLSEHAALGIAPAFNSGGYLKPERIPLIERGAYREALVSPRSAAEYDASPNGAEEMEFPDSADMEAGEMPAAEAAERLGDGLYINHLHYLNYSDRPAGRITGLTRFACFWVEGGRIAAPIPVMRFDDSIYRILGENLVALTAERELLPDPDTYAARSTGGALLPGALIESFTLTL